MRTFGSTWETVYIIGVPVALMVHVSQGASAFPESFFIEGFLFLMLAHAAFPHGGLQRLHSGFPPGGITPVVQHPTDFIGIGIMHLGVRKEVVPAKREGDVRWQPDMVSCTVAAVRNGNDDISVEPDALEIISGISREQSGEYGIEIDAELASVWGIGQKLMKFTGKLPFLQLERPPDFTEGDGFGLSACVTSVHVSFYLHPPGNRTCW